MTPIIESSAGSIGGGAALGAFAFPATGNAIEIGTAPAHLSIDQKSLRHDCAYYSAGALRLFSFGTISPRVLIGICQSG